MATTRSRRTTLRSTNPPPKPRSTTLVPPGDAIPPAREWGKQEIFGSLTNEEKKAPFVLLIRLWRFFKKKGINYRSVHTPSVDGRRGGRSRDLEYGLPPAPGPRQPSLGGGVNQVSIFVQTVFCCAGLPSRFFWDQDVGAGMREKLGRRIITNLKPIQTCPFPLATISLLLPITRSKSINLFKALPTIPVGCVSLESSPAAAFRLNSSSEFPTEPFLRSGRFLWISFRPFAIFSVLRNQSNTDSKTSVYLNFLTRFLFCVFFLCRNW